MTFTPSFGPYKQLFRLLFFTKIFLLYPNVVTMVTCEVEVVETVERVDIVAWQKV